MVSYLHHDQLGSVVLITDGAGARAREMAYRPYGEVLFSSAILPAVPPEARGFIGERFDAGAGLQYLNARYYDPKLGMFLQPDWFEVTVPSVGTNRYSYSLNDPVNMSDPGGNCPYCIYVAIAFLLGTSTDPANAPGPGDQILPADGGGRMVVAAAAMAAGSIGGPVVSTAIAATTEAEAVEEELSTLERNVINGRLAEEAVVADLRAKGVTVTSRVSISGGNVRCVADCVITGAPGQQVDVPPGFVAENLAGTELTTITLNSEGRAIIEVNTGGATLTGNQSAGYPAAQSGAATGVGVNAAEARMLGSFGSTPVYVLRR